MMLLPRQRICRPLERLCRPIELKIIIVVRPNYIRSQMKTIYCAYMLNLLGDSFTNPEFDY